MTTTSDRFVEMWNQQKSFMDLLVKERGFPQFPVDLSTKVGQKFITDTMHHCTDELHEARQHLKNAKTHRLTQVTDIDRSAYLEELNDAFHLFLEVVIASGFSIDELFESYIEKGKVNVERIVKGY